MCLMAQAGVSMSTGTTKTPLKFENGKARSPSTSTWSPTFLSLRMPPYACSVYVLKDRKPVEVVASSDGAAPPASCCSTCSCAMVQPAFRNRMFATIPRN